MTTTTTPISDTENVGKYSLSHLMMNLGKIAENLVSLEQSLKGLSDEATMALAMIDAGQVMSNAANYGEEVGAVLALQGESSSNPDFAPAGDYVSEAYSELDNGSEKKSKNQSKDYSLAHATGEQCENEGKTTLDALKSEQSGLTTIFKDLAQIANNMSSAQDT